MLFFSDGFGNLLHIWLVPLFDMAYARNAVHCCYDCRRTKSAALRPTPLLSGPCKYYSGRATIFSILDLFYGNHHFAHSFTDVGAAGKSKLNSGEITGFQQTASSVIKGNRSESLMPENHELHEGGRRRNFGPSITGRDMQRKTKRFTGYDTRRKKKRSEQVPFIF